MTIVCYRTFLYSPGIRTVHLWHGPSNNGEIPERRHRAGASQWLTGALRDLNEIRLFSIPNEAKRVAELKRDLRRQDRSSGGTAEETSAD